MNDRNDELSGCVCAVAPVAPRTRRFVAALAVAGVTLLMRHAPAVAQAPKLDLSENALAALASAYVEEYAKSFAFLIADEIYTQALVSAAVPRGDTQELSGTTLTPRHQSSLSRKMRSELFLTYLPVDREWIAVRDVIDVDGRPVEDREDLRQLLARREQVRGLVSQVVARNARYNIGNVRRNFNEPTLPLLLLEARRINHVQFSRRNVTREGDRTLVTLRYVERGDTLVSGPRGPVSAKGEFLIDAATGVVRRTTFELGMPGTVVKTATTYTYDAKLDLWLPSVFTERYESDTGAMRETVTCEAKYSNYRRFEVTARIK